MKGDFSRMTFDPSKHFSRVLMQQGRVQLDADWNEQVAILLHYLQALAADLIGPHGGPADIPDPRGSNNTLKVNCGFEIIATDSRIDQLRELTEGEKNSLKELLRKSQPPLLLGKGHYYVDGVLAENPNYIAFSAQQGYPSPGQPEQFASEPPSYLIYLDVWERHLTYVEVEDVEGRVISIREAALGGPDTATRAQVVWQVKVAPKPEEETAANIKRMNAEQFKQHLSSLDVEVRLGTCRLKARARPKTDETTDPCIISPEARYRRTENQLYRVEIHHGGAAGTATFKWSRDNGSVVFPIRAIASDANTTTVTLAHLGRDARLSLAQGDWVEIVDDDYVLRNSAESLHKVHSIDRDELKVTLKGIPDSNTGRNPARHPLLRRWYPREAENSQLSEHGVSVAEGQNDQHWIELEEGVQIQFQKNDTTYRTGDYWLIPARVATGDVEWPGPVGDPDALPPHGVAHHYAPLWIVTVDAGTVTAAPANDCRRKFSITIT